MADNNTEQYLEDLNTLVSDTPINWDSPEAERYREIQKQFGFGTEGYADRVRQEIERVKQQIAEQEQVEEQQPEEAEQTETQEQVEEQQPEEAEQTETQEQVEEQQPEEAEQTEALEEVVEDVAVEEPQSEEVELEAETPVEENVAEPDTPIETMFKGINNFRDAVAFMRSEENRNYLMDLFDNKVDNKATDKELANFNSDAYAYCLDVLNHPVRYMNNTEENKGIFELINKEKTRVGSEQFIKPATEEFYNENFFLDDKFMNDLMQNGAKTSAPFSLHLKRWAFDAITNPGMIKNPTIQKQLKALYDADPKKYNDAKSKFNKEYSNKKAIKENETRQDEIKGKNNSTDEQYKACIKELKTKLTGKVDRVCSRITTPFVRFSGWGSAKINNLENKIDNGILIAKKLPKRAFLAGVDAASNWLKNREQKKENARRNENSQAPTPTSTQ